MLPNVEVFADSNKKILADEGNKILKLLINVLTAFELFNL
jgi:hypothetical protein